MKRATFLNQSELRTLDLLERSFLGRGHGVYVGPRLQRLIEREPEDDLTYDEQNMLLHGEVDFAVVNREGGASVAFAVEFDGPVHEGEAQAARDRVKDRLLLRAGIPLIRVPDRALGEREQITLLEWVIDCYWLLKTDRQQVESAVQEIHDRWPDDSQGADLSIALHYLRPFPAVTAARDRLHRRFGIYSLGHAPGGGEPGDLLEAFGSAPYLLTSVNFPLDPEEHSDELDEADFEALRRGKPGNVPDEFRVAVLRRLDEGFETAYVTEAPIRWPAQDYMAQILTARRIGSWPWAVELALAEYQAVSDVERWAKRTLAPLDA